jgi:hypothetical protein
MDNLIRDGIFGHVQYGMPLERTTPGGRPEMPWLADGLPSRSVSPQSIC